jgi:ribosomal protein S18 acetylase RimI-like enzyme
MTGFARWEMRPQLSALWQQCFGDPEAVPAYFLEHLFSPRNCLVTEENGRLASAVYFLPAELLVSGKPEQAHYIYAAATSPEFRSRGMMSALLARAAGEGERRGDCWSAVLPAGDGLYRFYASAGYADFFQARELAVSGERLRAAAVPAPEAAEPSLSGMNRARNAFLAANGGSVLWSDAAFAGAAGMHRVFGDRFVSAGGAWALCRTENETCAVLEAVCVPEQLPALAAALLKSRPAEKYRFRLPAGNGIFPGEGELRRFGMLKGLGGRSLPETRPAGPYLGLAMD